MGDLPGWKWLNFIDLPSLFVTFNETYRQQTCSSNPSRFTAAQILQSSKKFYLIFPVGKLSWNFLRIACANDNNRYFAFNSMIFEVHIINLLFIKISTELELKLGACLRYEASGVTMTFLERGHDWDLGKFCRGRKYLVKIWRVASRALKFHVLDLKLSKYLVR